MTRPLRHKILTYQSDMGYQLLTRQVQGLIKLGMTVHQTKKRLAFTGIRTKVEKVEQLASVFKELHEEYTRKRFLKEW